MKSKTNTRVGSKKTGPRGPGYAKIVKSESTDHKRKPRRLKVAETEIIDDKGITNLPEETDNAIEETEQTGCLKVINCYEGMSEVKSAIAAVKSDIGRLNCAVSSMEPNMSMLIQKFCQLENFLPELKHDAVKDIVAEVLKALTSMGSNSLGRVMERLPKPPDEVNRKSGICDFGMMGNHLFTISTMLSHAREVGPSNTKTGPTTATEVLGLNERHEEYVISGSHKQHLHNSDPVIFPLMGNLSAKDSSMLNYLFSKTGIGGDRWSEEVARFGEFCVTRSELQCLSPTIRLSGKVINMAAAYLFEDDSQKWFFPTYFGERAKAYVSQTHVHGWVASTITICKLQRFHRRLQRCRQIFIPLNDDISAHWFMLVMDLTEQRAEVWDSRPDSDSEPRRLEYASAAIGVLQMIFANEMTKTRDVYFHFPSFTVTIPDPNPTVDNNHDSGIYVIRHMQYYRRKWFRGFNSEDQRIRLALEIVNHPRNEISPSVVSAASRHNQEAVDDHAKNIGDKGGCAFKNAGRIHQQSQPKHVPLPTGRKLRSHRKRRSRP